MGKPDEIDEVFNKSPINKEVPADIWGTIYPTWTGLWTDGYGEWDECQPSDIYPLVELLSKEAYERLKLQLLALKSKWEAEARLDEWDYAYECMRAANDTASLYLSKERDIRFAELNQLTTNGDK